jgi:hypothetical protein
LTLSRQPVPLRAKARKHKMLKAKKEFATN